MKTLLFSLNVCMVIGFSPDAYAVDLDEVLNISPVSVREMVEIPSGSFIMGGGVRENAKFKHKVYLDAFFIDKYEVTQKDYKKLMGTNPTATTTFIKLTKQINEGEKVDRPVVLVGDEYPVTDLTWYDAAKYCNWRSVKEGLEPCYNSDWECDFTKNGYRLPTEAEWEYACRAGSDTKYFFGNDKKKLIEYANYYPYVQEYFDFTLNHTSDEWKKEFPRLLPVGSKKPNKWGLYDMLGNVSEWCNDWYDEKYYTNSPENNPLGPKEGKRKIIRGGGFTSSNPQCAERTGDHPANNNAGFRCVRNAPKEEKAEEKADDPKPKDEEKKE